MVKISASLGAVLLLATLASGASINDNFFLEQGKAVNYFDTAHVAYYFACARGGLSGFRQGFYNNQSEALNSACLGQTTITHINQFLQGVTSLDIMQIMRSFGYVYQTSMDVQKQCRLN